MKFYRGIKVFFCCKNVIFWGNKARCNVMMGYNEGNPRCTWLYAGFCIVKPLLSDICISQHHLYTRFLCNRKLRQVSRLAYAKLFYVVAVTAPGRCCYCLNQASLTMRTKGRAGKLPVGGKTNRSRTATEVVIK